METIEYLCRKIENLSAQCEELKQQREMQYIRMLEWRGIDVENGDIVCTKCGGSGLTTYGNTATWRGGIGGMVITNDICDKCWGSGKENEPWTNLRRLR